MLMLYSEVLILLFVFLRYPQTLYYIMEEYNTTVLQEPVSKCIVGVLKSTVRVGGVGCEAVCCPRWVRD